DGSYPQALVHRCRDVPRDPKDAVRDVPGRHAAPEARSAERVILPRLRPGQSGLRRAMSSLSRAGPQALTLSFPLRLSGRRGGLSGYEARLLRTSEAVTSTPLNHGPQVA